MRKSIILAVVLMVALVAVPAFASVQNVKISGDVDSTWLYRNSFDFGSSITEGGVGGAATVENVAQSIFMTQTRLRVDADLTDQVSATVALINERVWTTATAAGKDIDLNLAYVTLREMLYSPLTVVVGRQAFSYGNSLVIDSSGQNNVTALDSGINGIIGDLSKQSAMDAIRLIFDYNPLTLEVLYAKINEGVTTDVRDSATDDVDLYGANATYELGDDLNTQVEAYFFARINKASNIGILANGTKSDTTYVPGLRASADVLDGLNIQGEVAWQRGNNVSDSTTRIDNEQREAFAAQFVSNYQIPNDILPDVLEEYNPALGYTYTYVSGDSNPADIGNVNQNTTNRDTAWDPMYEAQGGGTIYNSLFNLSNLNIHSISLTANPIEDVTTKVTWNGLWLDKKLDETLAALTTMNLIANDAAAAYAPTVNKGKTNVGYEVDFDTTYDYTEDVQFGASMGWFVPGDLFVAANDTVATQAIVHGIVNF